MVQGTSFLAKKTIKSIWTQTFEFWLISDIPDQTKFNKLNLCIDSECFVNKKKEHDTFCEKNQHIINVQYLFVTDHIFQ